MDEKRKPADASLPVDDAAQTLELTADLKTSPTQRAQHGFPSIDGYRIESILGKGGMGIVYRAVQVKLNRTVALKVLPAVVGAASDSMVSRFRREAMAAARLHHTNIIPVYDYGEVADGYYYAMELVDGRPLDDIVRQMGTEDAAALTIHRLSSFLSELQPDDETSAVARTEPGASQSASASLPVGAATAGKSRLYYRQLAYWFADAAEAMDYAHGQGIIHRDIKPANLILSNDGRLMVADFGLAKTVDDEDVTTTGSIIGTARYLSPEQAMGGRIPMDHRTDIYSLGATMYELLCFCPAYPDEDQRKLLAQVVTQDPRRPRSILPLVPPELETICLKAMEKNPDARYFSAKDLSDDLKRYLNDLPIAARRPSIPRRVYKFVKRHRVVLTVVTALTIAVITGITDLYQRHLRRVAQAHRFAESGLNLANFSEWEEAEKEFNQALAIYPSSVDTRLNMAWMYIKQSSTVNAREADELLRKGSALCEWVLDREPEKVSALNFYGVCLKRLGQYEAAAEQFLKVLEHEEFYAALSNLGACYAVMGENEQAATYLRKAATAKDAAKKNEWAGAAWRNLASFELHRKNRKASEYIEQSLSRNRADPVSLIVRAKILMQLGSEDSIDQALNDAVTADGVSVDEKRNVRSLVKRVRAIAHLHHNDDANAERYALEAIQLGDERAINLLTAATAQARLGRIEDARNSLKSAIEAWPENLKGKKDVKVTAAGDWLWYDLGSELLSLEKEARAAIEGSQTS